MKSSARSTSNNNTNFASVLKKEEEMKQDAGVLQFSDFYPQSLVSNGSFLFEMHDQDEVVMDEINRFATNSPSMDEFTLRAQQKLSNLGQIQQVEQEEVSRKRKLSVPRRALSSLFRKSTKE